MVDFRGESQLRRFKRVIGWESNREKEYSTRIWTISLKMSKDQKQSLKIPTVSIYNAFALLESEEIEILIKLTEQGKKRENGMLSKLFVEQELTGPIIVACHWNKESPDGPAEQDEGGSLPRSSNSSKKRVNNPVLARRAFNQNAKTHC